MIQSPSRAIFGVLFCLLFTAGCREQAKPPVTDAPEAAADSALSDSMREHFELATAAHDALLHGDLPGFREEMASLGEARLPPGSSRSRVTLHKALEAAAIGASQARDIDAAGAALGPVVLACGTCHSELGKGPRYEVEKPTEGANALQTAMLGHEWATERLWEGITGPSDAAWLLGAEALSRTDVFGDQGEAVMISEFVRERERHLRSIGEQAREAEGLEARAGLYGRLLATCAECHQAIRVLFDDPE
jgi:cytochrome c553